MATPSKIKSPKVIADPIYGIIDIRPVLAMVETEEFQASGRQAPTWHVLSHFPFRNPQPESTFFGSLSRNAKTRGTWIKRGFINKTGRRSRRRLRALSRIGHPAFSHVTEALCDPTEKGNHAMSMNGALSYAFMRSSRPRS